MNTPQQQAELYRKAAETIEMCAEHGIEPMFKCDGVVYILIGHEFRREFHKYEFPIAVISSQLVWADTVVYNRNGMQTVATNMLDFYAPYTLTPPKQPLFEVEGKPVYKGDKLWYVGYFSSCREVEAFRIDPNYGHLVTIDGSWLEVDKCTWNPPRRTVMVELSVERAAIYAAVVVEDELVTACRKALNNLKGDKS